MSTGCIYFFFNDTATTEIYTLSLHDALPISGGVLDLEHGQVLAEPTGDELRGSHLRLAAGHVHADLVLTGVPGDRKSTRLNSSHANISYAVFCLKKKKKRPHLLRIIL